MQRDALRDVPPLMLLLPFVELAANQTRHNAYTSYIDLEDIIEEEEETLGEHGKDFSCFLFFHFFLIIGKFQVRCTFFGALNTEDYRLFVFDAHYWCSE